VRKQPATPHGEAFEGGFRVLISEAIRCGVSPWGAFRDHGLWESIPFPFSFLFSFFSFFSSNVSAAYRSSSTSYCTAFAAWQSLRFAGREKYASARNVAFFKPHAKALFSWWCAIGGKRVRRPGTPWFLFSAFFHVFRGADEMGAAQTVCLFPKKKESKTILCKNNQPSLRLRPDSLF